MTAGVLMPATGRLIEPYILVWLGALLFLNSLRLNSSDLVAVFKNQDRLPCYQLSRWLPCRLECIFLHMLFMSLLHYRFYSFLAFLCYGVYCIVGYAGSTGSAQEKRAVSSPRAMSTMCLLPCLHSSSLARKLQRLLYSTMFLTILEL
jgi:hypothetical protein